MDEIELEYAMNTSCPICNTHETLLVTEDLRRGSGKVQHCPNCDHSFLIQQDAFDAKQYYAEEYRKKISHQSDHVSTDARELFDVYSRYQTERLRIISPILKSDTRLLEVGASSGQFLWHIKDEVKHVHAIELDKDCCVFLEQELKIPVDDEFLERSRFAGQQYDVVCAFQVMEHVENPVKFLLSLIDVTSAGGNIFIEVPNLYDPLLTVWDVPAYETFYYHSAHLHYFSPKSLRKVASLAGFSECDIEIIYSQDYNLLNHLNWIMNDSPQPDCHIGLSEVALLGRHSEINSWLSDELVSLNKRYVAKLAEHGLTSNLMMRLKLA